MCKCSYLNEEELKTRRNRVVLPSSASSSQVTTPKNNISSPSSSTSQREISTTFFSSPRSPRGGPNTPRFSLSPRQSQALEARSTKDEARSGGSTPRIFLPQLERGKLKRRVTIGSSLSASSGSGDAVEADWPPFADEDYIVFCFEEDGAFHVVMEESPKTNTQKLQCEEHGNLTCACSDEMKVINQLKILNRRDCLLPNKEAEEEPNSSELSPRSLIDVGDHLLGNNKLTLENELTESMECRNGSVESTDSSQLDDDEQFENEYDSQAEHLSSHWNLTGQDDEDEIAFSALRRDLLLPNTMADEENSTLSPKSQMTVMFRIDELLNGDNDVSSIESDQSSGFSESESRSDNEEQLERNEELISESVKSSISRKSKSSIGSFKFPVLECEWIGSPVKWPKPERVHYRRHRSRPACLTCCKFWKISNLSS